MTSLAVAEALAGGLAEAWPGADLICRPLSSGGEGLVATVDAACSGSRRSATVNDDRGRIRDIPYWISACGSLAVVELARLSQPSMSRRPDTTKACSSRAAGSLIAEAARSGAQQILVGAGDYDATDGGVGALSGLGFEMIDRHGASAGGDEAIGSVTPVATAAEIDDLRGRISVLWDRAHPMTGPAGAAAAWGRRTGAEGAHIREIDASLRAVARALATAFARDPATVPEAGAGGGLAGAMWASMDARLIPGAETVAQMVDLNAAMVGVDLVVTAVSRLGERCGPGDVPGLLAQRCEDRAVPLLVFAPKISPADEAWGAERGAALIPFVSGPVTPADAILGAPSLLPRAASRTARLWALARGSA